VGTIAEQPREVVGVGIEVLAFRRRTSGKATTGGDSKLPALAELGLPLPRQLWADAAVDENDGLR
jgi:hypothetical protein